MASDKDDALDLVSDWDTISPTKPKRESKLRTSKVGILDVHELKAATEKAIQEGAEKKRLHEESKVAAILQKTTERARKEAARGKSSCRVMKLQHEKDFVYGGHPNTNCREILLRGLGKAVMEHLKAAKIQADFERERNYSGYDEDVWLIMKW